MKSLSGSRRSLAVAVFLGFAATACSTSAARPILTSEPIPDTTELALAETTTSTGAQLGSSSSAEATTSSEPSTSTEVTESSGTTADTEPTQTTPPPEPIGPAPLTGSIQFKVVGTYPHDPNAFTQGLEFVGADLYESTGLRGQSDIRITDPITGEVRDLQPIDDELFGEGITVRDGVVYQLTYTAGQVLLADPESLDPQPASLSYDGEGWGLCTTSAQAGRPLVMSNGTPDLTIRDPQTFEVLEVVPVVAEDGSPVFQLNELECVGTTVLSNIWLTDEIVSIDLESGQVIGRLNLAELKPSGLESGNAVLNGIAYRPQSDTYFITGKLWPVMYELALSSG